MHIDVLWTVHSGRNTKRTHVVVIGRIHTRSSKLKVQPRWRWIANWTEAFSERLATLRPNTTEEKGDWPEALSLQQRKCEVAVSVADRINWVVSQCEGHYCSRRYYAEAPLNVCVLWYILVHSCQFVSRTKRSVRRTLPALPWSDSSSLKMNYPKWQTRVCSVFHAHAIRTWLQACSLFATCRLENPYLISRAAVNGWDFSCFC
jgi:hypothetical protein